MSLQNQYNKFAIKIALNRQSDEYKKAREKDNERLSVVVGRVQRGQIEKRLEKALGDMNQSPKGSLLGGKGHFSRRISFFATI